MAIAATRNQIIAMATTERVSSVFSLMGILFILSTFALGRGFDKPINRLIFLASWSNLGMNIATLIAEDGPVAGQKSALCQFQAFAIQMFLGVDALWALCMSVNVYLALFRGWTSKHMRALEWKYFVACYGCSFVPAFSYLFVNTQQRGRVYGPALLWCWVSTQWDFLRVATLYAFVWVALGFAIIIYVMAFAKVWKNRDDLKGIFNPLIENPFAHVIVTEVEVTSSPRGTYPPPTSTRDEESGTPGVKYDEYDPYSVDVHANPPPRMTSVPEVFQMRTMTRNHALNETNPDAWLYARVAFLFFCSLLICWVPASINRVYSIAHPDSLVFWLNYIETLLFPLQGFFNTLVYIVTSQTACRNLWRGMTGKSQLPRKDSTVTGMDGALPRGSSRLERLGLGKAGTKLDRFTTRRSSERLGDDPLTSSTTSLRGH